MQISTGGFSVPLPPTWEDRTVPTVTGPTVDGVTTNIVVTREPLCDHMGLGGFADGWVHRLREELPVRELRAPEHAEVAGVRAQVRTLGWSADGVNVVQLVALLVTDDHGYAVVGTAAATALATLEPAFRATLGGFRLAAREVAA